MEHMYKCVWCGISAPTYICICCDALDHFLTVAARGKHNRVRALHVAARAEMVACSRAIREEKPDYLNRMEALAARTREFDTPPINGIPANVILQQICMN